MSRRLSADGDRGVALKQRHAASLLGDAVDAAVEMGVIS